jgi:5-methylcytosine-specific restriction protein A
MPGRPPKPCAYQGCPQLTQERFCSTHQSFKRRQRDSQRPNSSRRGYGYRWQQAREAFLRRHPLCVMCLEENRYEPATVVDHVVPHRGDVELFWDRDNWQPLGQALP